jgi:hypothetical protein
MGRHRQKSHPSARHCGCQPNPRLGDFRRRYRGLFTDRSGAHSTQKHNPLKPKGDHKSKQRSPIITWVHQGNHSFDHESAWWTWEPFNVDLHTAQFHRVAKLRKDGNVGRISTESNCNASSLKVDLCRIESIPSIPDDGLEPGM